MKKETKRKIVSWINQTLIFVALFFAITWWQQKDMLQTNSDTLSPTFALVDMENIVRNFVPDQQEQKTLIYFFAPWCGVCHASIDNIEAIKRSAEGEINFYIIALDWKSKQEVEVFLSSHDITIPVVLGTRETQAKFQIGGFPSYYVIDSKGKIQSKDMGYTTELGMRIRLGLADA
ncbi:MAG: TlpA family protein disulfide reductase [Kangiellaceae bacterium]|nr:TlpA family protein disulfide reductase [Kangiellaceae bacterium]